MSIKDIHIFQLNSYKIKTHCKWIIKNIKKYVPNIFIIIFALVGHIPYKIFLCLYILISFIIIKKTKHKKPLVYTTRVIRLITTSSVISIFAIVLWGVTKNNLILPITLAIIPVLIVISNILNAPIENLVKLHYIKSAKKTLDSMPSLTKVGITGSFGKTSMKFYLATLLKAKYNTLMTPESFNTPMGIVRTVREHLKATDEIFIAEMGARNVGDIKELCNIVNPKYGIITSIGHQHLESFKTIENIIKTKLELADSVANNGLVFINGDDDLILANIKNKKYISYGLKLHNDYRAYDIHIDKNGTTFKVQVKNNKEILEEDIIFNTSLIGMHNVLNIVGAISFANYIGGISLKDLKPQVKKIPQVPHRMQIIKNGGLTIIDDSYNSNPKGAKEALNTLSLFESYKILITPGMVELGSKENEYNFEFGVEASKICDYIVLVGDRQTKYIYEGILSAGFDKNKIFISLSFTDGFNHIKNLKVEREKIVLLENDLPDNY